MTKRTHVRKPDSPERWRGVETLCGKDVEPQGLVESDPTCDRCRYSIAESQRRQEREAQTARVRLAQDADPDVKRAREALREQFDDALRLLGWLREELERQKRDIDRVGGGSITDALDLATRVPALIFNLGTNVRHDILAMAARDLDAELTRVEREQGGRA